MLRLQDASMNAAAGKYEGLDRYECRKALWADMEAAGLAIKREPYQTRVPRSQRGGEVIEPMVSKQWFVRMEPLAKPALAAVAAGDIKIVPERFEKTYNFWLENIKDWCISRQLWWGHRIPVWYVFDSEDDVVADGCERYVVARSEAEARALADEKYGSSTVLVQVGPATSYSQICMYICTSVLPGYNVIYMRTRIATEKLT